ncbi:rod-binding protein [bacterium]|nr:rod-binding protein [bacterium]
MEFFPSSPVNDMYEQQKITSMGGKINDLGKITGDNGARHQKLKKAAEGFEAMFINLLLSQMRKTIPKSDLIDGGNAQEIFESMFYDEIAKRVSQRGELGIADKLMAEYEKHIGKPSETENVSEENYED